MVRHVTTALILLGLAGFCPTPGLADDMQTCNDASGEAAIAACTRALNSGRLQRDDRVRAHNARGMAWKQGGDYDRAIADYNAALQINPKYFFAHYNRGISYTVKGEWDRAIADFDTAIRLNPKSKEAHNNRGGAYMEKGELDRAIADFTTVLRLDPKFASGYGNRGVAFRRKGELDRAIADYNQAIRLDPSYANAYNGRGVAYQEKGDHDRAIVDFGEALRLDPGDARAYVNRGVIFEKRGDLDRARADFRAVLAMPPRDGDWAHNTARERLAAIGGGDATPATASPRPQTAPPATLAPAAAAERRVALVIGNSAYANFPKIPNPRHDAEDLAKSLKELAFDVLLGLDLKRAAMEELLIDFARKARQSDTALVFYAGHGLQHNGINYLAPVDAVIGDETDLRKLVNLQDVINDLQSASRIRILIVDACRDNEVIKQLAARLPATRSAAFARGLAKIDAADGTLIAFATQPNRTAADGTGRNSPFTQALLKHLPTPGLELRTLMTRVRAEVVNVTGGTQPPEVWDSLVGEFAFRGGQ